jgi:outer membrane protein W
MRKPRLFVIALLFIAPTVFAQRENSFSVFLNPFGVQEAKQDRHWYSSYGAAFESSFTPRFSAQIAIGSEQHRSFPYVVDETGYINQVKPVRFRTYPIDVTGRFRFVNDTRWKPYIGAGARYVAAPHVDSMFGYTNRWTPELVGGVVYQLRHFGIVADGKLLLGDHEYYDSAFKTSFGLNWRF